MVPLLRMKGNYPTGFLEPSRVSPGDCVVIYYPTAQDNNQLYSPIHSVERRGDSWFVTVEATWKNGERLVMEYAPGDLCEIIVKGKA